MTDELTSALESRWAAPATVTGRVVSVRGGVLRARVPDARVGACFEVARENDPLVCEVVGFDDSEAVLLPFGPTAGVRPGAGVTATQLGERAPDARRVLGRVVDALGQALDGAQESMGCEGFPLSAPPPPALSRQPIGTRLHTGIRVVDALLPMGVGQRVGLFAGSGVGKSTLLAQLARQTNADVCVVGLIGERGREVGEFLRDALPEDARARTTVVVATSDAAPSLRVRAAHTATAIAEQWRAEGKHVLLLVDSVTRYARALREVALAAGEPPARRGYPASVFSTLPLLLERSGQSAEGAISAVYTVLVDGGDMEEPIADEIRGIVDGHWVLSRRLAERAHFPAVDALASVSRVAGSVSAAAELDAARGLRKALALLAKNEDAIDLGIYRAGSSADIDAAIELRSDIDAFLRQSSHATVSLRDTCDQLFELADQLRL
jgi:FliI/YscN family ATPase